ncbi:MAG: hypothetical protein LIP03_04985 [Bacteroidales bacterium]|nr:hypothetical protein [Bacteroidales bacterium]
MCKLPNTDLGIKNLDFRSIRGKMRAALTDGRQIIIPLGMSPDIKKLPLKKREQWMILDDQFFTFNDLSTIYSVEDLMRYRL